MRRSLPIIALVALLSSSVWATEGQATRFALVIGANQGAPGRSPLQFAQEDAAKVATTFISLGGIEADHVVLLQGPTKGTVLDALASLGAAMEAATGKVTPGDAQDQDTTQGGAPIVFLWYFSGHSDGQSLELGDELLSFGELKAAIDALPATSKVVVIDACHSGAAIEVKGGSPGPLFEIPVDAGVVPDGMAIITSASPGEHAQESAELGGSYFTHHWVSGLHGVADLDGDGKVSLGESFSYAASRTTASTASTLMGVQHPTYRFELGGQGELYLTGVADDVGAVALGSDLEGTFFVKEPTGKMVAEVAKDLGEIVSLNLVAGSYLLIQRGEGTVLGGEVVVTSGAAKELHVEDFGVVSSTWGAPKGEGFAASLVYGGYTMGGWLMREMGMLHQVAVGYLHRFDIVSLGVRAAIAMTEIDDDGLVYDMSTYKLHLAPLVSIALPYVDLLAGPVVGVALMSQSVLGEASIRHIATFDAGLSVGLDLHLSPSLDVLLLWDLTVTMFELNEVLETVIGPEASLAVGWRF